jgi:hypothetical protein
MSQFFFIVDLCHLQIVWSPNKLIHLGTIATIHSILSAQPVERLNQKFQIQYLVVSSP